MNEQKPKLWWADRLRIAFAVLIMVGAMLAQAELVVGVVLAFLAAAGFFVVEFLMNRCPHCDRHLDRNWGKFCQHCGERIREDKADT